MGEEKERGKKRKLRPFQSLLATLGVLTGLLKWNKIRSQQSNIADSKTETKHVLLSLPPMGL